MTRTLQMTGPFLLAGALCFIAWLLLRGATEAVGELAAVSMASTLAVAVPFLRRRARHLFTDRVHDVESKLAELRQFVPLTIADQIAHGNSVDAGVREVSIMFVDLRDYTELAERLGLEGTFALIDRFTEAVSRAVRDHGGFVVEFNGDGLMAVFGAPLDLAGKERAALRAAQKTLEVVASIDVSSLLRHAKPLEVGIGIATGRAFVGTLHAADRCVWSAVGPTTNLASRLESLTREFEARIVVDDATRTGAGFDPGFVPYPNVRVRGVAETVDLYVLPRVPSALSAPEWNARVHA